MISSRLHYFEIIMCISRWGVNWLGPRSFTCKGWPGLGEGLSTWHMEMVHNRKIINYAWNSTSMKISTFYSGNILSHNSRLMETIDLTSFYTICRTYFTAAHPEKYPPVAGRRKFPSIKEITLLMVRLQFYKFLICNPPNLHQSYPTTLKLSLLFVIRSVF